MKTLFAHLDDVATRAGGMAATLVLVAGCVTAGGLTAPPDASSAGSASPAAIDTAVSSPSAADDCGTADLAAGTSAPYTIASLAAGGRVFVVGEVKAIEPAIFNTVDGKKPPGWGANWKIFTPVVLQVEQVLRGETKPGAVRVLIEGGAVGCYTMTVDVAPHVELQKRYVFILNETFDANGKKLPDLQVMWFAWPVNATDVVQTAKGPMPLASLALVVAQASPTPTS
jgi:hypothetical protein